MEAGFSKVPQNTVTLKSEYPTKEIAEKINDSLSPDNDGFVKSSVEGNVLICEAEADSILSLRATLDDLLACLDTSERILEIRDRGCDSDP